MKTKKTEQPHQKSRAEEKKQENKQEATTTDLKKELESCQIAVHEWKSKYIRIMADFENLKKRTMLDQKNWVGAAQAEIFGDLLSIVDDFERALTEEKKKDHPESVAWLEGFALIHQSLQKLLKKFGVEEITEHEIFNPIYHEALAQVKSPEHESGTIIDIMQKGYRFKDKVLRPAKVTVAK